MTFSEISAHDYITGFLLEVYIVTMHHYKSGAHWIISQSKVRNNITQWYDNHTIS